MDKDRLIEILKEVQVDIRDCRMLIHANRIEACEAFLITTWYQLNVYMDELLNDRS